MLAGAEPRSINRKTLDEQALYALLAERGSWVHRVASRFRRLIRRRIATPAFHPNGGQRILPTGDSVFAVLRSSPGKSQRVLALTNVTDATQRVSLETADLDGSTSTWRDILTSSVRAVQEERLDVALRPYEVLWLTPAG